MIRYRCVAAGCPFPDETYEAKLRRPPACNLGHCRIESVEPPLPEQPVRTEPEPVPERAEPPPADDSRPAIFDFIDETHLAGEEGAVLIARGRRFPLPASCIIGRHGVGAEVFAGDLTVSRVHARLTVNGQLAYLENVSERGNTLAVNDVPVSFGAGYALKPGINRVQLGRSCTCEIELRR